MTAPPLLLHVFPTFAIGGAQARTITLANAFGPKFRHAIVAMDGRTSARDRLDAGLDVNVLAPPLTKGDTLGNLRVIRRVLREARPDVLITSNWGSIEWAMAKQFAGVPHIHMEDGFGPEERARQLPRRVWTRRIVLRTSRVMVPSKVLEALARDVWRLPGRAVRYIPNGIDLERFVPMPSTRMAPVVGTVAGLRAEKNVARLIEAFARMPDAAARLLIVGDGPERARLERQAAESGAAARITFAGNAADPAPCYRDMDVFALSSDTEQMPISVLEAMASGLPVVSTDVGDVGHMVAPENRGFVVPMAAAALTDALSRLCADGEARRRLGAANRERVEAAYGLDRMVDAHAALIAEVMGTSSAAAQVNQSAR